MNRTGIDRLYDIVKKLRSENGRDIDGHELERIENEEENDIIDQSYMHDASGRLQQKH